MIYWKIELSIHFVGKPNSKKYRIPCSSERVQTEADPAPLPKSRMGLIVAKGYCWVSLNIVKKNSILDVYSVLDPLLKMLFILSYYFNFKSNTFYYTRHVPKYTYFFSSLNVKIFYISYRRCSIKKPKIIYKFGNY